jgi:LuxR family transcriptional regulator, maltose regulon positive regulatory protein
MGAMRHDREARPGASSGLIGAKLREQHAAVSLLPRHGLAARVRADGTSRLILLRAPAGYGKTTLLAQHRGHLAEAQRPHGWLTVDRVDREAAALLPYLAAALRDAGFRFERGVLRHAARKALTDVSVAARLLVAGMRSGPAAGSLMIDGIDRLAPGSGVEFIEELLRYAEGLQIVATARRRPALELAALRAAGLLHELGPGDLRFSAAEVEALFDGTMPLGYVYALLARTDGVPVALSFACQALEARQPGAPWTEWLNEYYQEQVLDSLPCELQELAGRLVIADTFDTSLARAIMGRDVGAELERLLVEEGVLSIDPHSGLFHFPAMLRETLRKRLQWVDEAERREMHRRASAWFASRGLPRQALSNALAANDGAQAFSLFGHIGAVAVIARLGHRALESVLEQMSSAVDADRALLGWSRVLLLTQEGRTAEAALAAEQLASLPAGEGPGILQHPPAQRAAVPSVAALVDRESLIIDTLVAAYADRPVPADREQALGRTSQLLPEEEHMSQGLIRTLLCWMQCQRADFAGADREAECAIAEFTADDGAYASLFMHLHRAIIRVWQNRLAEALAETELLCKLTRLFFPTDLRLEWLSRVFRSWALFEVGRLDETQPLLEGLFQGPGAAEGWFEAQLLAHVTAARVAAAREDKALASSVIAHGSRLAADRGLPRLRWHMEYQRAELTVAGELSAELGFHEDPADDPVFFTWRERLQSAVLTARWMLRAGRPAAARAITDRAACELASRDIPRARTILTLLRARIALAGGDRKAHERFLKAAARSHGAPAPASLYCDEGLDPPPQSWGTLQSGARRPATRASQGARELTRREREILDLVAAGCPNKVVARRIGLSEGTVKFHLRNIYRKLNAHNRAQAISRRTALGSVLSEGKPGR